MLNKHLRVGITGGIGAGKSIICKIFEILGVSVYDADTRAKRLMNTDVELVAAIKELFGEQAYHEGKLNRTYLSKVAFDQPEALEKLNGLVHPRVGEDYKSWVGKHQNDPYSLKEAALLFESGSYRSLHKVIHVSAPQDLRMERVLNRDPHRTKEDVQKIIEKQWSEQEKIQHADFLIKNDGSELVIPRVLQIHQTLLNQARR